MSALDIRSPVFSVGTVDRICVFSLLPSPATSARGLTIKYGWQIRFYCGILEGNPRTAGAYTRSALHISVCFLQKALLSAGLPDIFNGYAFYAFCPVKRNGASIAVAGTGAGSRGNIVHPWIGRLPVAGG